MIIHLYHLMQTVELKVLYKLVVSYMFRRYRHLQGDFSTKCSALMLYVKVKVFPVQA